MASLPSQLAPESPYLCLIALELQWSTTPVVSVDLNSSPSTCTVDAVSTGPVWGLCQSGSGNLSLFTWAHIWPLYADSSAHTSKQKLIAGSLVCLDSLASWQGKPAFSLESANQVLAGLSLSTLSLIAAAVKDMIMTWSSWAPQL